MKIYFLKSLFGIAISCVFAGCVHVKNDTETPLFFSKEFKQKASKQERKLVDSLYQLGYYRFYFQLDSINHAPNSEYSISFYKKYSYKQAIAEREKFRVTSKELANYVYKNVMNDSLLYRQFDIRLACTLEDTLYKPNPGSSGIHETYKYDSLVKWNGFKVIKNSQGKYERVPVE